MKKAILYFFIFILLVVLGQAIVKGYNYSGFRQEFSPTYSSSPKNYSDEPPTRLQLKHDTRTEEQMREFRNDAKQGSRYNASCQFGVCTTGGPSNQQK